MPKDRVDEIAERTVRNEARINGVDRSIANIEKEIRGMKRYFLTIMLWAGSQTLLLIWNIIARMGERGGG